MKILLIEKGAEEAYQHCNNVYGVITDMQNMLLNDTRTVNVPDDFRRRLLKDLKVAETECKKSYDWICALKE